MVRSRFTALSLIFHLLRAYFTALSLTIHHLNFEISLDEDGFKPVVDNYFRTFSHIWRFLRAETRRFSLVPCRKLIYNGKSHFFSQFDEARSALIPAEASSALFLTSRAQKITF